MLTPRAETSVDSVLRQMSKAKRGKMRGGCGLVMLLVTNEISNLISRMTMQVLNLPQTSILSTLLYVGSQGIRSHRYLSAKELLIWHSFSSLRISFLCISHLVFRCCSLQHQMILPALGFPGGSSWVMGP